MKGRMLAACFSWLRFGRQMPYVATEIGPSGSWLADVSAATTQTLVEIEIKTSLADLRRDFETKKYKHQVFESSETLHRWQPNKMYFLVPKNLTLGAEEELAKRNPRYGLIVFDEEKYGPREWDCLSVSRRAGALHERPPSPDVLEAFVRRMGSELSFFYGMHRRYGGLLGEMRELSKAMLEKEEALQP